MRVDIVPGEYVPELYEFLRGVAANNSRPWFQEHKEQYLRLRQAWYADLDRLIDTMAAWEPGMRTQTAKSAAYRFYRDTRFSPDKSPYKTHFSALLSPMGRKTRYAAYYVELGLEGGLYAGIWCPDSYMLRKVRNAIVDNIDEWREVTRTPDIERYFPGWESRDDLKTVPKGWPKDHPQADLLRKRQYGKFCPCPEEFFSRPEWIDEASERLRMLKGFVDFINYSIDEDTTF